MTRPTVSVVLPTHDRAWCLLRSIESVLRQTFESFELIVVDDGSADDTERVVAGFADPRIRYVRLPRNRGAGAARNVGVRQSSAPLLAFQDSDDEWLPAKLERHLREIEGCEPDVAVVYSDMQRVYRDGTVEYHRSPTLAPGVLIDPATRIYQVCKLGIQSTVIRRECFEAVGGFDELLPALEDLELFIRLSKRYRLRHLREPLVRYHETDGLSNNMAAKAVARRRLLDLYEAELLLEDPAFVAREASAVREAERRYGGASVRTSRSAPEISVCVCTFRRPAGLLRLLRSLRRLDPATPPREVIVVDNDAERSGAPSVEAARAEGLEIRYVCEPRRGIARARNRSVGEARGAWVAFIDDDEEAEPGWLLRLWSEVSERGASAGMGPVIPHCADAPRWLVDGGFFDRPRFPTGTVLHAGYTRTANALVRRAALCSLSGPFDERYDLTGGEDTHLFARLIAAGGRVVAVDSAIVHEHLPAPRTTARALLRRRFFHGIGMGRLDEMIGRTDSLRRRARLGASVVLHGAAGLLLVPFSKVRALRLLLWAAQQLGRLAHLHGYLPRPYESGHGVDVVGEPASRHAA